MLPRGDTSGPIQMPRIAWEGPGHLHPPEEPGPQKEKNQIREPKKVTEEPPLRTPEREDRSK